MYKNRRHLSVILLLLLGARVEALGAYGDVSRASTQVSLTGSLNLLASPKLTLAAEATSEPTLPSRRRRMLNGIDNVMITAAEGVKLTAAASASLTFGLVLYVLLAWVTGNRRIGLLFKLTKAIHQYGPLLGVSNNPRLFLKLVRAVNFYVTVCETLGPLFSPWNLAFMVLVSIVSRRLASPPPHASTLASYGAWASSLRYLQRVAPALAYISTLFIAKLALWYSYIAPWLVYYFRPFVVLGCTAATIGAFLLKLWSR